MIDKILTAISKAADWMFDKKLFYVVLGLIVLIGIFVLYPHAPPRAPDPCAIYSVSANISGNITTVQYSACFMNTQDCAPFNKTGTCFTISAPNTTQESDIECYKKGVRVNCTSGEVMVS